MLSGCFNHNVHLPDAPGLLRRPLPGRWDIHLRQFDEPAVLRFLGTTALPIPKLLDERADGFVIEFIDGVLLEQLAPPRQPVAFSVISELAHAMRTLHQLPTTQLGRPLAALDATDTRSFAHVLIDHVGRFAHWARPWAGTTWATLGMPADPIAPLRVYADAMTPRMAVLIHVDIHRRNAIVRPDGTLVLIDWEFAVIGDPVYDLARHCYMMSYTTAEVDALLAAYAPHTHSACYRYLRAQLEAYCAIEAVKEALVLAATLAEGTASAHTRERLSQILPGAQAAWAGQGWPNWCGQQPLLA